ncbi:MAG: hypothetical protein IPJ82_25570 [Lewinellaceae bacterium]|nr:hypothetical protein [Lewinellaceae bacterium]
MNQTIAKTDEKRLSGIGFAIPGPFDYRNGVPQMQHKFLNLYNIHIPSALNPLLATERDQSAHAILNDATSFAVGKPGSAKAARVSKSGGDALWERVSAPHLSKTACRWWSARTCRKEGCLWHLPYRDGSADNYFSTGWFVRALPKNKRTNRFRRKRTDGQSGQR